MKDSDIARQAQAERMPLKNVDVMHASAFCAVLGGFFVQVGSYALGPYSSAGSTVSC